jgi:hypothetical protein
LEYQQREARLGINVPAIHVLNFLAGQRSVCPRKIGGMTTG